MILRSLRAVCLLACVLPFGLTAEGPDLRSQGATRTTGSTASGSDAPAASAAPTVKPPPADTSTRSSLHGEPSLSSAGSTPVSGGTVDVHSPQPPPQPAPQAPAPAPRGPPGGSYSAPPSHIKLENLSRDLGYQGGRLQPGELSETEIKPHQTLANLPQLVADTPTNLPVDRNPNMLSTRGDQIFRNQLRQQGYTYQDSIDDRGTGMQALVVKDPAGRTSIIFRGTEPTADGGADLFADLRSNPGVDQYNANRDKLNQWARDYPGATVTGHSLGAALGQQYIADHPESVSEGVFFNAPAVGAGVVDKFNRADTKPPITLYQGSGDPVSEMGGEAHLPSRVVIAHGGNVDPDAEGNGFLAPHSGTMLQPNSGTSLNETPFSDYETGREPTTAETGPLTDLFDNINIAGENISGFWTWLTNRGEAPPFRGSTEPHPDDSGMTSVGASSTTDGTVDLTSEGRPCGADQPGAEVAREVGRGAARDAAQNAAQTAGQQAGQSAGRDAGRPPGGGGGCAVPCR